MAAKFRQKANLEELKISSEVFEGIRDLTPGREVIDLNSSDRDC